MESSLDAVQFLANSPNRVQVLTALVDGDATRRELQDEVEASRSTVSRILEEGQTRGWVDSEGTRYWLTQAGEAMVTDFRSYLETVEGHQHLDKWINYFPPPLLAVDFRHLRDADIVNATKENPGAPFTRTLNLFHEATAYRGLNTTSLPQHARVLRDRAEQGDLDFAQVFEKPFIETIRSDPERTAIWEPLTDRVWVYDGVIPINLQIVNRTTLVWLGKTRDETVGVLESKNPTVLSWAESLYEEYRTEADVLTEL